MKMRKRTAAITAGALLAAGALATGCAGKPGYGQPAESPSPSLQAENNIPVPVYGPPPELAYPAFAPENNIPEDVYGPPMPYEDEEETEAAGDPDLNETEASDEDS